MSYHAAVRRAVFAALDGRVGARVFSNLPAGTRPPFVLIERVAAEPPLDKSDDAAFYEVDILIPLVGTSYADLDEIAGAVATRMRGPLPSQPDAALSDPDLVSDGDETEQEAVGGPVQYRRQTYRLLAQPK